MMPRKHWQYTNRTVKFCPQFDDNVYQARRNAHRAIEMCVHMSPGTEGVVDAKLVPVLVGKLLKEEDEIKVCSCVGSWLH